LNVRYGHRVSRIGAGFEVRCENDEVFTADRVVVATGFAMNVPPIAESRRRNDTGTCRRSAEFTDQRVSSSARATGLRDRGQPHRARGRDPRGGPRSINFAWRTHFIGHLRAINNNFLDTYQLKTQNMVLDGDILRTSAARRLPDHIRVRPAGQGGPARVRPGHRVHRLPYGPVDLR
jgi:hypothetical protein